jgi:hypothetical protein
MSNDDPWVLSLGAAGRCSRQKHIKTAKSKISKYIRSAPEVMVKITSFSKDSSTVTDHLSYISRNGELPIYDSYDRDVTEERFAGDITRETADVKGRKTVNMILSMPEGTEKEGFKEATKDFLRNEFSNHDYHYAFHDDKGHFHAHIVVPMVDRELKRINPRKEDIQRYREGFAESLEKEGILANAMRCVTKGKYPENRTRFQEMKRKATLFEHGEAPYENNPDNNQSYFVTVDMEGTKKTYWGVGLAKPLQASGLNIGDKIQVKRAGEKAVNVEKKIRENGKIVGTEKIEIIRNDWEIKNGDDLLQEEEKIGAGLKQKTLASLKSFHTEMVKIKDMEAAELVNKFVGERFQTSFTVTKENSQGKDKDERTR